MSQKPSRATVVIIERDPRPTLPCPWCSAPVAAVWADGRILPDLAAAVPASGGCWACNPSGTGTRPRR